jgi:ABC-type multidrug transport system fused ATPase/permease subunit
MTQPNQYYQTQLKTLKAQLKKFKRLSLYISISRLVLFILLMVGLYVFHQTTGQVLLVFFVWLPFFLFLVSKSIDYKQKIAKTKALININHQELSVLDGHFSDLPTGDEFINPEHDYSYDIDLFGKGSFFQYLNRSYKKSAQSILAGILTANDISEIEGKQAAVKDLANRPGWCQNFRAESLLVDNSLAPGQIQSIIDQYRFFTKPLFLYGSIIFSLLSLLVLALFYTDILATKYLIYWVLFGLTLAGIFAKKTHQLYQLLDLTIPSITAYAKLLKLIDDETFSADYLNHKKYTDKNHQQFNKILMQLIKIYRQKEMTNNMIVKFIGNSLFLTDWFFAYRLEKWLKKHGHSIADIMQLADFFEAEISLGTFAFNHPDYVYPDLVKNDLTVKTKELGHPLILHKERIDNDFAINRHEFYIITGANMAGKSTFLRTVALSIVMANTGLPVCAKSYTYNPIKLITSMRTSDSLQEDSSYFFSELKRLQYIINKVQKEEYFIVLDEILKGTNSKDKAEGSEKFLERLTQSKATGLIATHDLSLCKLADKYNQIANYYFDAEIIDNELYFDYTLKNGICKNMNASFLLKKMNII